MTHRLLQLALVCSAGLVASCASEDGSGQAVAEAPPAKSERIKSGDLFDDDSAAIAERFGAVNPMYTGQQRKSATESTKTNSMFEGEFAKREFAAKDYGKKSFWGTKEYAKKVYGGDTDGSRFLKPAREGGAGAREGAMVSRESSQAYDTGSYGTGAAREAGVSGIARTSDAETDVRRRVWKQPEVRDYRNQRALSVEDTKWMLGR